MVGLTAWFLVWVSILHVHQQGGHHPVPSPAGRETTDDEDDVPAVGSVMRLLATGNEVNDDGNGTTGDDNDADDGDGDGEIGSSATGYDDNDNGNGQRQRR